MEGTGLCAGNDESGGWACGETQMCSLHATLMFLPHQKSLKEEKNT